MPLKYCLIREKRKLEKKVIGTNLDLNSRNIDYYKVVNLIVKQRSSISLQMRNILKMSNYVILPNAVLKLKFPNSEHKSK